jgi:photosystem II stability/assembly factor-like uncharacterized protein
MSPLRRRVIAALAPCLVLGPGCHEVHFDDHVAPGQIDVYDDLFAVSMPSEQRAVAVGYRGAVYVSENGGDSWEKRRVSWGERKSRTDPLLYSASLADPERGWLAGQLGTVLRTKDGGKTWEPQANAKMAEGFHLFSIHAIDANTAWAVGEWGTRILTEDGGASWQDQSLTITIEHPQYVWLSPPEQEKVRNGEKVFEDVSLNDVYCRPPPSTRCWVVGEFGYIFWSDDRGHNWHPAKIAGGAAFDPVYFAYDTSEISDADGERLKAFIEQILDQSHLNVLIEAFANEKEIKQYASGDDPSTLFDILEARTAGVRAVIEETGILSDRLRLRGTPPWDYEDFLDDDPQFLERYLDGRRAERPMVTVQIAQNPYLFQVRFKDDQNGIITGLGGVVLTSDDGGQTWFYGQSGTRQALYTVATPDGRAIAAGEKGLVRVSEDGGRSWKPIGSGFPEIFTFMRQISFAPASSTGLIVGQRGLVLRTRDAGLSWEQVLPPPKKAEVAAAD